MQTVRDLTTPGVDRLTVHPTNLHLFTDGPDGKRRGIYQRHTVNPGYGLTLFWFSRAFDVYTSETIPVDEVEVRDLSRLTKQRQSFGPASFTIPADLF
jgi:hypothetical protein